MNEGQAFFSQPGVGFFTMLLIGAIAGWIAERVTSSNHGIFTNILVGIAGSFVGAKLAEIAEVPVFGFVVAMNLEITEEELFHTIFPHPTISETMKEAVLDAYGRVLNM